MKTYDQGGDVTATHNGKDVPLPEHAKDTVYETEHVPMGKPSSSLPPMETEIKPTPKAPLLDEGGDIPKTEAGYKDMAGSPQKSDTIIHQMIAGKPETPEYKAAYDYEAEPSRYYNEPGWNKQNTSGWQMLEHPETWRPPTPELPVPKELKAYDRGGDVRVKDDDVVLPTPQNKGNDILQNLQNFDQGGDVGMRQLGPRIPHPSPAPPLHHEGDTILENTQNFDQGGDVGAPADFGGRVLPNPRGLKPMLDTEIPPREKIGRAHV